MCKLVLNRFFEISDFLPIFGHKILNSGHVMWSRDVILGGVVQFTMLVILNKKFLIFGVITKSPQGITRAFTDSPTVIIGHFEKQTKIINFWSQITTK